MSAEDDARSGPDPTADEVLGTVAEEAAKLWQAVQGWASDAGGAPLGGAAEGLVGGWRAASDHVGHGPDCTLCPVCLLIRRARQTSPEVREHLAVAIGALAQAATAALRDRPAPDAERPPEGSSRIDLED